MRAYTWRLTMKLLPHSQVRIFSILIKLVSYFPCSHYKFYFCRIYINVSELVSFHLFIKMLMMLMWRRNPSSFSRNIFYSSYFHTCIVEPLFHPWNFSSYLKFYHIGNRVVMGPTTPLCVIAENERIKEGRSPRQE